MVHCEKGGALLSSGPLGTGIFSEDAAGADCGAELEGGRTWETAAAESTQDPKIAALKERSR